MVEARSPGEVWRAYAAAHPACAPELSQGAGGGWHWHCRSHGIANFGPQSREAVEIEVAEHVAEST